MTTIATLTKFSQAISLTNELRIACRSNKFIAEIRKSKTAIVFKGTLEELDSLTMWLDETTKQKLYDSIFAE